jgi:hypothetical protein
VEVIVKKLSDAEMIQIMASENMDEWGSSAIVEIETIEAVVKAFAAGKIKLAKPASGQYLRVAPSFLVKEKFETSNFSYNTQTIADFLGWTYGKEKKAADKVHIALTALQYIEEGVTELSAFSNMKSDGIRSVIKEARQARAYKESRARQVEEAAERARKEAAQAKKEEERARARKEEELARQKAAEHEDAIRAEALAKARARQFHKEGQKVASKVIKAVSEHLRSGGGTKNARDVAIKAAPLHARTVPPDIEEYLKKALSEIWSFCVEDKHAEKLNRVLEYKKDLDEDALRNAQRTLLDVRDRMARWADRFEPGKPAERRTNNSKLQLKNS